MNKKDNLEVDNTNNFTQIDKDSEQSSDQQLEQISPITNDIQVKNVAKKKKTQAPKKRLKKGIAATFLDNYTQQTKAGSKVQDVNNESQTERVDTQISNMVSDTENTKTSHPDFAEN